MLTATVRRGTALLTALAVVAAALPRPHPAIAIAQAGTLIWAGHTWVVSNGAMAGHNIGSAANVSVDGRGFLHLRIAKVDGQWRCAELFTTDRLGFGIYQWQVQGRIDRLDAHVVLGLFPYGPAAGLGKDGTNEIDVEYSRWGHPTGPNGDWTVYPASGTTVGERAYSFTLAGDASTSRFTRTPTRIDFSLLQGFQPPGVTPTPVQAWSYVPAHPGVALPQLALPVGMNLWLLDGTPPSDGRDVSVVIRAFTMLPRAVAR